MNEPLYQDSEYESIRSIFDSRGNNQGQLPGKRVAFIPAERADKVLALDERIQTIQKLTPYIVGGAIILAFFVGLML